MDSTRCATSRDGAAQSDHADDPAHTIISQIRGGKIAEIIF
jgi:hypothetical protein